MVTEHRPRGFPGEWISPTVGHCAGRTGETAMRPLNGCHTTWCHLIFKWLQALTLVLFFCFCYFLQQSMRYLLMRFIKTNLIYKLYKVTYTILMNRKIKLLYSLLM